MYGIIYTYIYTTVKATLAKVPQEVFEYERDFYNRKRLDVCM